jgi:(p)ppGpp synthase/HD superfamily hydrolase
MLVCRRDPRGLEAVRCAGRGVGFASINPAKSSLAMGTSRLKKLMRKLGTPRSKRRVQGRKKAAAIAAAPAKPLPNLLRAATFAARKHHGQMRADNQTPYFSHVTRVTLILAHLFGVDDEAVLTAALLHDTLEDTATDYDEIAEQFGPLVADYVVQLTKNVMLPKAKREADYEARLCRAPEPVMIAKMADLYDNLSDRINSPKLYKTAETAERLLAAFEPRLASETGHKAHALLTNLLDEIKATRLAEPPVKTKG